MVSTNTYVIEAWGDLACYSRPEMKVERYSYPVITPSAARGIFDAIYYKPDYGFYWQIERIEILAPLRYIALRRNEVKDKAPGHATVLQWKSGKKNPEPLWADGTTDTLGTDQKGRTQRQTMALKDVRYRLHAHMCLRNDAGEKPEALGAQFERRARHGKCFYQPFFGCREFPAFFELVEEGREGNGPVALDLDLGFMLYDVFDLRRANGSDAKPCISVFHARIEGGVLTVPPYHSDEVRKPEGAARA